MSDAVKGLSGLQLVGRFGGVDDQHGAHALLVDFDYRDAEGKVQSVTRRCVYAAYSSLTGETSEVHEAVGELKEGEQIAVSVWINSQGRNVTYRAMGVVSLDGSASSVGGTYRSVA